MVSRLQLSTEAADSEKHKDLFWMFYQCPSYLSNCQASHSLVSSSFSNTNMGSWCVVWGPAVLDSRLMAACGLAVKAEPFQGELSARLSLAPKAMLQGQFLT